MRKLTSVSTGGLVDFRSDKERIARNTKATKKAVKEQTKLLARQHKQTMNAATVTLPPPTVPAGWHPDPLGRHEHRYWDGTRWTDQVADAGVSSTDPIAL